jgi:hypothetical protein
MGPAVTMQTETIPHGEVVRPIEQVGEYVILEFRKAEATR